MEGRPLAKAGASGLQAATAHLPSFATRQRQGSPQTPETLDAFLVGKVPGRTPGYAGQPGQENGRRRWGGIAHATATAAACPRMLPAPTRPACPPDVDTQATRVG